MSKRISPRPIVLAALAMLALSACRQDGAGEDAFGPDFIDDLEQACIADGGRWGAGVREGTMVCYRNTRDGGRMCSASSDCEGLCLARSRTCAPVTPLLGCHEVLGSSGGRTTLCIE